MKPKKLKIVLADDHAMVREGLAHILEEEEDMAVVGQATDGAEALRMVKEKAPQVVVLDYSMPEMEGPQAAEYIRAKHPHVRVLVLTMHDNPHYASRALRMGAHGFVLKSAATDELVQAIRTVMQGKTYVSPPILEKLTAELAEPAKAQPALQDLTTREFQLMRLLGAGKRLQECAAEMHISQSTASTYRSRLLTKLRLRTTGEIIRFALENKVAG